MSSISSIDLESNDVFSKSSQQSYDGKMSIDVIDVEQYNVLILGELGAGKTTLQKILRNINYEINKKVRHSTQIPVSRNRLFSRNEQYFSVNIVDTPGFPKTKDIDTILTMIRNIITSYVSKSITKIDLLLLVVNGSIDITTDQIANITSVLKFFGRPVAPISCLMVTHFELQDIEDEKKWIFNFTSNPNMRFLSMACQGGFLFTGALDKDQFNDLSLCSFYTIQQCRRNSEFFNKLINRERIQYHFNTYFHDFHKTPSIVMSLINNSSVIEQRIKMSIYLHIFFPVNICKLITDYNFYIHHFGQEIFDSSEDNFGKMINNDETIKISNSQTGKCDAIFKRYNDGINRISVLLDGRIISSSINGRIRIWNPKIKNKKNHIVFKYGLYGINFCDLFFDELKLPDISNYRILKIWNPQTTTNDTFGFCITDLIISPTKQQILVNGKYNSYYGVCYSDVYYSDVYCSDLESNWRVLLQNIIMNVDEVICTKKNQKNNMNEEIRFKIWNQQTKYACNFTFLFNIQPV